MTALIVWSQLQSASTPAFLNKCMNAFSASSTVGKPLCGIGGSSGRFGRAGRTPDEENGRFAPRVVKAVSVPLAGGGVPLASAELSAGGGLKAPSIWGDGM